MGVGGFPFFSSAPLCLLARGAYICSPSIHYLLHVLPTVLHIPTVCRRVPSRSKRPEKCVVRSLIYHSIRFTFTALCSSRNMYSVPLSYRPSIFCQFVRRPPSRGRAHVSCLSIIGQVGGRVGERAGVGCNNRGENRNSDLSDIRLTRYGRYLFPFTQQRQRRQNRSLSLQRPVFTSAVLYYYTLELQRREEHGNPNTWKRLLID